MSVGVQSTNWKEEATSAVDDLWWLILASLLTVKPGSKGNFDFSWNFPIGILKHDI